jgi:hypothetical protein
MNTQRIVGSCQGLRVWLATLSLLISAQSRPTTQSDSLTIVWSWRVGQVRRYRLQLRVDETLDSAQRGIRVSHASQITIEQVWRFEAKGIDPPGTVSLEARCESLGVVGFSKQTPIGNEVSGSESQPALLKDANRAYRKARKSLLNSTFSITMNSSGEVLAKRASDGPPPFPSAEGVIMDLEVNDRIVAASFAPFLGAFIPNAQVSVGGSWNRSLEYSKSWCPWPLNGRIVHEVIRVQDSKVQILGTITLHGTSPESQPSSRVKAGDVQSRPNDGADPADDPLLMHQRVRACGADGTSEIVFSIAEGCLVRRTDGLALSTLVSTGSTRKSLTTTLELLP